MAEEGLPKRQEMRKMFRRTIAKYAIRDDKTLTAPGMCPYVAI